VNSVPVTNIQGVMRVAIGGQPRKFGLKSSHRVRLGGGYTQLHQRDQAPVRAHPFLIWMNAESTILSLAIKQARNNRPTRDLALIESERLVEEIPPDLHYDPGLVGRQKP
jgi:hypothetical protein